MSKNIINDIDLLPENLRAKSLSKQEIVLLHQDALEAIAILVSSNWALLGWEGWVKYADGKHGHPREQIIGTERINQHAGETWNDYVQRSAHFCRQTIDAEQRMWDAEPMHVSLKLYFCLTAMFQSTVCNEM